MNRNLRFLVGSLVIVSAIAWLMYTGIRETSAYYLTLSEFAPQREALAGEEIRIAGRVTPGTIQWDPKTLRLDFAVGDPGKSGGETVPVAFTGVKPDMFADGRDVIIEGRYHDGTIRADKVLTSCPSKYEAKTEGAGPAKAES